MNIAYTREFINPDQAQIWLDLHNSMNRKLSKNSLARFVWDMKHDRWCEDPSRPITFAEDGTLIDGQHRLMAIVLSKCGQWMWVCRGASKDTIRVIDTGKSRSAADVATIEKVPYAELSTRIVRNYLGKHYGYTAETIYGGNMPNSSNWQIMEEYYTSPALYQEAAVFARQTKKNASFLTDAEVGGIYVYLVKDRKHESERVRAFFDELIKRDTYPALFKVRNRLIELANNTASLRGTSAINERQVLLAKAWNTYLADDKGKSFVRFNTNDKPIFN